MIEQAYAQAEQHLKAGRANEAADLCREVLARAPSHAGALHLLGVTALQADQPQAALDLIDRAIAIDGRWAPFHNNRGSALRAVGREAEAAASFRRALTLRPDYPRALVNLGRALIGLGQSEEAVAELRRACSLAPGDLEACSTLATLLHQRGGLDEAATFYERALQISPGGVELLENLARLRLAQGRSAEGIQALGRALQLKPVWPQGWAVLAGALQSQAQLTEAVDAYRRAVGQQPDFADAFNGLGNALADLGQIEEAVAAYRRAVELQPEAPHVRSNLIMTLHELPGVSAADILAEARLYGASVEPRRATALNNVADPDRVLRVGYVSADFRDHPVGSFLDRVLPAHDPQGVEIILYSDTQFPDAQTARLRASAQRWRPIVGLSDAEASALIREDGVDILVDLAGHTGYNRLPLFAMRPAPVQTSWLGYFGTTGLAAMDYVIADEIVLPPGEDALFTEQPVRLPSPYLCWAPPVDDVPLAPPPVLEQGFVTFGCFNNRRKVNAEVIALWARILRQVESSRLFLKSWSLADAGCRAGLVQAFGALGVAADRLMFEGLTPRADALAAYNRVDIALDPFPFGGCTTTADTLWMGVPVVTRSGERWSGRMSQTILMSLGLAKWVAESPDAYVDTAVRLASDPAALATGRAALRDRMKAGPFCDGPAFARRLEAAYRGQWRAWCDQRLPGPRP